MQNQNYSDETQQVAFCELLDRILNKGVVIAGDVTISVAGVDLIYLNLYAMLCSVETARKLAQPDANIKDG